MNFPTSAADPGPRNGQFPTDPFLVNGPVMNRALLDQLFPPGSDAAQHRHVTLDNPDRAHPAAPISSSVGFERQLGATISVSADYVHVFGPRACS